jgi:hypothetical protein
MFRTAIRAIVVYLGVLAVACIAVRWWFSVATTSRREVVASVWKLGELTFRAVQFEGEARDPGVEKAVGEGGELVLETIVGESPILTRPDLVFGISFVPGKDGVKAKLGDRAAFVTPDDLLSRQLYDKGLRVDAIRVSLGIDMESLFQLLAERLHATPEEVRRDASFRRIRVDRTAPSQKPRITADNLRRDEVRDAVIAGAHFLARGLSPEGRFRYAVSAPTNADLGGYDWPRHAGATFFLAQVAGMTREPALVEGARRAAALMTASGLSKCGDFPCVGEENVISLGSSALAVVALSEIVERKIDPSFVLPLLGLTRFLRAQQRPDGEFMHYYDRTKGQPIDTQGLYYSSEATLALARSYVLSKNLEDLDAAVRGLKHLVGPAWSFFGNRYYFGEEHWTCQALGTLWPYAKNYDALDFCLGWQRFGRALQQEEGDSFFDSDGAIGVGPVITPRLTPVASRCEAAVATLDVAERAGVAHEEIELLDRQTRRALALLMRQQLRPGPRHLFKSPGDVNGAMPGSQVDWELRIDYTQHTGSALVRWLELTESKERASTL